MKSNLMPEKSSREKLITVITSYLDNVHRNPTPMCCYHQFGARSYYQMVSSEETLHWDQILLLWENWDLLKDFVLGGIGPTPKQLLAHSTDYPQPSEQISTYAKKKQSLNLNSSFLPDHWIVYITHNRAPHIKIMTQCWWWWWWWRFQLCGLKIK